MLACLKFESHRSHGIRAPLRPYAGNSRLTYVGVSLTYKTNVHIARAGLGGGFIRRRATSGTAASESWGRDQGKLNSCRMLLSDFRKQRRMIEDVDFAMHC
jgi:hypothetical protein